MFFDILYYATGNSGLATGIDIFMNLIKNRKSVTYLVSFYVFFVQRFGIFALLYKQYTKSKRNYLQ
jgi:hypothetical protein